MTHSGSDMELVPQPRAGTRLRETDGEAVLVSVAGLRHVVNETALALWELCDGETTPTEMTSAVSTLFALDPDVADNDVRTTLQALTAAGLLEWVPRVLEALDTRD